MSKSKHERERQQAHERIARETERIRLLNAVPAPTDHQAKPPEATYTQRSNEKENPMGLREGFKPSSFTDYCLAVFTGLLVVVAIYQIIITKGQLDAMRTDERAWLRLGPQPDTPGVEKSSISITCGQPVNYPFQIANIGKTGAINIEAQLYYSILDASQDVPIYEIDDTSTDHPHNYFTTGFIYPNEAMKYTGWRPQKGNSPLLVTKDESIGYRDGMKYLAIFGIVSYDDVFGNHHWAKFCRWWANIGHFNAESCARFNSVGDK